MAMPTFRYGRSSDHRGVAQIRGSLISRCVMGVLLIGATVLGTAVLGDESSRLWAQERGDRQIEGRSPISTLPASALGMPEEADGQRTAGPSAAEPAPRWAPVAPSGTTQPWSIDEAFAQWYPFNEAPPFQNTDEDGIDVVYPGNARFSVDREVTIPDALRADRTEEAFDPGYFIVHFAAGVDADAKQLLNDLTGVPRAADGRELARWYIPNGALLAFVDSYETWDEIASDDSVDAVLPYHPAYKLSPWIGRAEIPRGRTYFLNVDLVPGHSPIAVARNLVNRGFRVAETVHVPGQRGYDVHYLVVESLPGRVIDLARVEGIRYIQESGQGIRTYDLSGGGKIQSRTLTADDGSNSPIVTASNFPLWLVHDLQGQGQLIGVVDTSIDWNNTGSTGCGTGFPDTAIDNWGFALPNLSRVKLGSVGSGGVSLKIPRADILGGATLQGSSAGEHGSNVAGAALADFYGNRDNKWWEHDVDTWESWAPANYSGLMGPGIAHEAQLYFTPVMNSSGQFRWESFGEFESNMGSTLNNMAAADVSTTVHSTGLAEASNTYTQVTVVHDLRAFDHPNMLQCMAAGNDGAVANSLSSQAVSKNALTVGASDDVLGPENRASFSSIGPTFDGRIKPDIMTPGTDDAGRAGGVASLLILPQSNGTSGASCAYGWTSGTSFAAPIAAGAGALVHQYFEEGRYPGSSPVLDPSAALMKAMLVNSGHRLTGAAVGSGYPNSYQGWGEVNLSDVLELPGATRELIVVDVPSSGGFTSSASANDVHTFDVTSSAERLRVTLAWTDEPGSVGAGKKLINDLHLLVTSPGGSVYRGNVMSGGLSVTGGSADTLNNLENVIVANPSVGTWTVTVDPSVGNYAAAQGYAVVMTGDISEDSAPPPTPVASFTGSPTSGTVPLTVSFSNTSTDAMSYSWSFGDGATSSAFQPSHTYTAVGTYTVTLTATGAGGSDSETRTSYINVAAPPAPVASFTGTPTSGFVPLTVEFSNNSTGSVSGYSWSFGDGGTSTATQPTHTYTSTGNYTVSLTASGPGGSDTFTRTSYISVGTTPAAPVANFSGTPTSGTAPLTVQFSDLSTGSVDTYSWNFGDGAISSLANPSHVYTSAGTYTVSLTASGPGGSDGETKSSYIVVDAPVSTGPLYYFSFTSNTAVPGVGTVADEDIVSYDPATGVWTLYFDGSDVGLGGTDINAFSVGADGSIVFSVNSGGFSLGGLIGGPSGTSIDDSDLVLFTPISLGSSTSGTMTFFLDGSDVGLTTNSEDIDGVCRLDDNSLLISTLGSPNVSGVSGRDEDVLWLTPTALGSGSAGTWSLIFDGSDLGLTGSAEDLNALSLDYDSTLLFSTVGSYSGSGGSGADEDLSRFTGSFGTATSGTLARVLDLSALGISTSEDVDGFSVR